MKRLLWECNKPDEALWWLSKFAGLWLLIKVWTITGSSPEGACQRARNAIDMVLGLALIQGNRRRLSEARIGQMLGKSVALPKFRGFKTGSFYATGNTFE